MLQIAGRAHVRRPLTDRGGLSKWFELRVAEYRETLISLMQVCVVGHFWRKNRRGLERG
jgi:hypothetical protein